MKKALFLLGFFTLMAFGTAYSQDRVEVVLTIHPVKLTFKAHKKKYYKIFGDDNVMYITSEKKIYTDIASHLPTKAIEGRSAKIVGASLPLSAISTPKEIRKLYRQKGIDVNQIIIYEVTAYQLDDDLAKKPNSKGTASYKSPGN
jgi:hypothetical protein